MFFYLIRQEEFKDGSGTRKSSSFLRSSTTNILPTLFASLVFLFLLGQVKGDDGGDGIPVGFFNHTLKDGMVTLSEGTVEVNETNLELFTNHSGACEVTFEGNFIVLHYKRESIAARNGCTVDLLTNLQNMISFTTEVKHSDVFEKCLGKCKRSKFFYGSSDNLLPFAYSTTEDKNITEITNGPIYKENVTCYEEEECQNGGGRCMPWTSLEVAWSTCDDKFFAHTHPIGEAEAHWRRHKFYGRNDAELSFNLNITKDGNFIIDFEGEQMDYFDWPYPAFCIPEKKGIAEPVTWVINGNLPNSNYTNLLVFHMLPQKAARKYIDGKIKKDDPPDQTWAKLKIFF